MKYVKILSLTLLSFACGKDDKKSSSAPASPLIGEWATECQVESEDNSSFIQQFPMPSLGTNHITFVSYSDDACKNKSLTARVTTTVTASSNPVANLANTYQLDSTVLRVEVTPGSLEMVTGFNQQEAYGLKNWVLNTPKDVTGKNIEGNAEPVLTKGYKNLDIYRIENGVLNFGDDSTTNDASAEYPTALESIDYIKK